MADYSQTAASVIPGANAKRKLVTLAETVTAGQLGYILSAGTAGKADGNDSTKYTVAGYFESGGAVGQRGYLVTEDDDATLGITFAVGDIAILSTTPGGWAPAADAASGTYVTSLGVAKTTTKFNFKPVAAGAVKA